MKLSLLEIVQDILNDLDSDEVNSINETVEASQVAQIVKTSYYEILANRNWPHLQQLVQFESSGDTAKPNYLKLPANTKELILFKYDVKKTGETKLQYLDMKYKYPDEFLSYINNRNSDNSNVLLVTDFSGTTLPTITDKAPEFWTSFDDEWIVCDSYDSAVDDTLKKSKTQAMCYIEPTWSNIDSFIPDLPSEAFPLLVEEAKSTAFLTLKQMPNQKAEMKAGRQQRWLSRKAWKTHGGIRYDDYGRKSRK